MIWCTKNNSIFSVRRSISISWYNWIFNLRNFITMSINTRSIWFLYSISITKKINSLCISNIISISMYSIIVSISIIFIVCHFNNIRCSVNSIIICVIRIFEIFFRYIFIYYIICSINYIEIDSVIIFSNNNWIR